MERVKTFHVFYGNRRFITVFTTAHRWSLSWSRCCQSKRSHTFTLGPNQTLSPHLLLGLLYHLFSPSLPINIFHAFLIPPIRAMCPTHLILHDLITPVIFGEAYKSWSSTLCSFLYTPATSSVLDPNILLSTLFSNTRNQCSSLSVNDEVSHPYKTRGCTFLSQEQFKNT